jgi:predicted XRE-type DNA-binding protein
MPREKEANKPGHITTGNVLEDLGFSAEEIREIELQHDLWAPIRDELERRKLTQSMVAKVLQIHQPDASLLMRGQIARFSITRLLQFADRLGLAVTLTVVPKLEAANDSAAAPRIPMRKVSQRRPPAKPAARSRTARIAALA